MTGFVAHWICTWLREEVEAQVKVKLGKVGSLEVGLGLLESGSPHPGVLDPRLGCSSSHVCLGG